MITVRHRDERGAVNMGWLDSRHTFSFGHYFNPSFMGFRSLRVINDDRIIPGAGFPTHGHADMEIISYVLDGGLAHRDTLGNESVIRPGDVQRMSAGTGIKHSEFNASKSDPAHFLQIWILPEAKGLTPGYEEKRFEDADKRGRWRLVGSRDGREGSVTIHQDINMLVTLLAADETAEYALNKDRFGWIQVARGIVTLNGIELREGDGAAIAQEEMLGVTAQHDAEVLLFDMA